MINFAELKLKLTEFNEAASCKMHDLFEDANSKSDIRCGQIFKHAQLMQFTQDAKIISELLDVIEMQGRELLFYYNRCLMLSSEDITQDERETYCAGYGAAKVLFETESKLKQLIKGELSE